jgi:hypothetical protein
VPSSRGFKISPWGMYRYRRFVVLKLSYQIFWLSNTFFLPGVGWATIVVICYLCIGQFPLWLSTKTVKVSRPKFCFQSDILRR